MEKQAPTVQRPESVRCRPPCCVSRFAEVMLRISDGRENRDWPARVGFTAAPLHRPLLGFAGLTVNAANPGK